MAGYSATPLVKKLGIKSGFSVAFVNTPNGFLKGLDLPTDVEINSRSRAPLDFALLFVKSEKELRAAFSQYAARLKPAGMLWVAWPKKVPGSRLIFHSTMCRQSVWRRVWLTLRFVRLTKSGPGSNSFSG